MIRRIGGPLAILLIVVELIGYLGARKQSILNLEQEGTLLARYQAERIRSSLAYVETGSEILCTTLTTTDLKENPARLERVVNDILTGNNHLSSLEVSGLADDGRLTVRRTQGGALVQAKTSLTPESMPKRTIEQKRRGTWLIPSSNASVENIYHIQQRDGITVIAEMPIRLLAEPFDFGEHDSAYGFLATGVVVLFTNLDTPATTQKNYTDFIHTVVTADPAQGRFYRVQDPINGEPAWVGTARVGDLDLVAGVVYPESSEFAPLQALAFTSILETVLALLVLALGIRSIAKSLSVPLETLSGKVSQAVNKDFVERLETPESASEEVTRLAASFNTMLDDLHRYLGEKEEAMTARQALESEINIAARIQNSMMPRFPYRLGNLVATGRSFAARRVGGDFLGAFPTQENHLGFCIGDVSGKGVPAAIYMAFASSLLQHLGKLGETPDFCLNVVNQALCEREEHSMFATCFFGVVSPYGEIQYCNAGHHSPLVYKRDGRFHELEGTGELALGIFPDTKYRLHTAKLERGDRLLFFTDGVTEAMNAEHEEFGMERLESVVSGFSGEQDPDRQLQALINAVEEFRDGCEANDDLTILCVGWD